MSETAVFTAIVAGGLLLWFLMGRERPARYRKKTLLTGRERDFFYRLRRALPDCIVCPQLPVSALIEPSGIGRVRKAAREYIEGQKVGYAVFDREMRLVAIVELDHRSRLSRRKAAADAYFASAGIKTVRFQAKRLPSEASIHTTIYSRSNAPTMQASPSGSEDLMDSIEFKQPETPWRNTVNVHI